VEGKIEGKRVVLGGGDALAIVDGLAIVDCRSNASNDVVVERDIAGRVRDPHSVEDRTDSGVGRSCASTDFYCHTFSRRYFIAFPLQITKKINATWLV